MRRIKRGSNGKFVQNHDDFYPYKFGNMLSLVSCCHYSNNYSMLRVTASVTTWTRLPIFTEYGGV